jgi:acyl-CoA synthetase (AMP-forming)/AMP-acid ligase II
VLICFQYFRDPKATVDVFHGGYFATGDIAIRFPDGSISIQDRSKDLIISGGEVYAQLFSSLKLTTAQNASSLAIEQELSAHPDILEVTVVARKHDKWGERVCPAYIDDSPDH